MIRGGGVRPAADADPAAPKPLDEAAVKKILADYLRDNPGAGMPSGVQTGLDSNRGFFIRSAPDPKYVNWDDGSKIPFELRIRGRIQADYYYYKTTDVLNHQTGALANPVALTPGRGVKGANSSPDFSQLMIKRMRLIFEGTAFDPNLRYHIQIDGQTRGIGALAGGGVPTSNGLNSTGGVPGVGDCNGVATVDHALRLFSAYIAYDMHPCGYEKGCGPDCPDVTYRYTPTVTAFIGKARPMVAFEEYLGSNNQQFVEYGMSNWFFDADDDNYLMGAGTQIKAFDDRLWVQAIVTNGNETQIPNLLMDNMPGINIGAWWDFGGTWNEQRKRWDLFGDCLSDIDYSCNPVVRAGGAINLVPMGRRSLFTSSELDRARTVPGAPGGTSLTGVLNGGGVGTGGTFSSAVASGLSPFAVDAFDSYSYNVFIAAKWRGFSLYNEWWMRNLDNFRGQQNFANGQNRPILYNSTNFATGGTAVSLFPSGQGIIDFGTTVQGGYFIVPK